jgi:hypothetical protein
MKHALELTAIVFALILLGGLAFLLFGGGVMPSTASLPR